MSLKRRFWSQNSFKECRRRPVHDIFYDVMVSGNDYLSDEEIEAMIRSHRETEPNVQSSDTRFSSYHSLS